MRKRNRVSTPQHTPPTASMTAFARYSGGRDGSSWTWEIKSLNGRGLEARFRLPAGYDEYEVGWRRVLSSKITRGSLQISLSLDSDDDLGDELQVNEKRLAQYTALKQQLDTVLPTDPPRFSEVIQWRGVLSGADMSVLHARREALAEHLTQDFLATLDLLVKARHEEGAQLRSVIERQLSEITGLVEQAKKLAETGQRAIFDRFKAQLAELLGPEGLSDERIAQEAAALAVRADIREELDRLDAHLSAADGLLANQGPVGRKFDFLVQEFNREANTLCSKAATHELKEVGLALKSVIDQLREQIQNVE